VWYLAAVLSIVVVIGFAAAAYEINHLRNDVKQQSAQIADLNVKMIYVGAELQKLIAATSKP
jgi:hypothetical protein